MKTVRYEKTLSLSQESRHLEQLSIMRLRDNTKKYIKICRNREPIKPINDETKQQNHKKQQEQAKSKKSLIL